MPTAVLDAMMADFWYNPKHRRGAIAKELASAERRLGLPLPPELKTLLGRCDGGVSNYLMYGEILVPPFRGITAEARENMVELYLRMVESRRRGEDDTDWLPPDVIIFANDADAWFGLDYRKNRERPSVVFTSEPGEKPKRVAASFRAFLQGLSREDDAP